MIRLLLLSYYWPPCGGHAVQRWVKFVKYLVNEDTDVTVVTSAQGDYPYKDYSLAKTVENIETIRVTYKSFKEILSLFGIKSLPYGELGYGSKSLIQKIMVWFRLNLIIPDIRLLWNLSVGKKLKDLMAEREFDLIITTGPPHSTHLLGLLLKKKYGLKWVTDFRDPWADIVYLEKAGRPAKKVHKLLEKKICEKTDKIIAVSHFITQSLPYKNKSAVIYNSFDSEFSCFKKKSNTFRVKYIGSLTQGQDISPVLKILDNFVKKNSLIDIEFFFVGTYYNTKLIHDLTHLRVNNIDFVDHKIALEETFNSDLLILLINDYLKNYGMMTTKIFEYIYSRNFILGFGPEEGEANLILKKYNAGYLFDYGKDECFEEAFKENYTQWKKGSCFYNTSDLSDLSAKNQTEKLRRIISEVIDK